MQVKVLAGLLVVFSIVCNPIQSAQATLDLSKLAGTYKGGLQAQGQVLPLVFHFTLDHQHTITATLDSPAQGAVGIPIHKVELKHTQILLDIKAAGATFSGELSSDHQRIVGHWQQGENTLLLTLERQAKLSSIPSSSQSLATASPSRPQHPVGPFNYLIEEVEVTNQQANISLAGTLTIPKQPGPHPAVVLITGSGPQDRDQTFMGHKTFWVLADHLTRQGIAVLRLDDRGVGQSTGDFNQATSLDFAQDVSEAVNYLATLSQIKSNQIGLIGHSEGGLIAPITKSLNNKVSFIVMLAGPGQTGNDIAVAQIQSLLQSNGVSESSAKAGSQITQQLNQTVLSNNDQSTLKNDLINSYQQAWQNTPLEAKKELLALGGGQLSAARIHQLSANWTKYFLSHNPADYLTPLTIPILAIHGDKDTQMQADANLALIQQALNKNAHKLNKIQKVNGLNHLFQKAESGAMHEYAQISQTIAPEVLILVTDWIKSVTPNK